MSTPALRYTVRDRSILLPFYKRLLVEPLLPVIPRRLAPNAITHAGHLVNLAALLVLALVPPLTERARWPYFVVAALVHVYLWCDNADGGHARRTNQCSAMGEFLDHGLDLLNATYIAAMSTLVLGVPPFWSAVAVVVVPAAAAVTYWEQAETGMFQLGLFNQIESVAALTLLLVIRGTVGSEALAVHVGPVSLAVVLLATVVFTAGSSILASAWRVAKKNGSLVPFAAPLGFAIATALAIGTGTLGTLAAIVVGTTVFVFLGIRQLTLRVRGRRPLAEHGVLLAAAALTSLAVYHALGGPVGARVDWVTAGATVVSFGGLALFHAVRGHRDVARLDRIAVAAG